ncbi:uncharacterized protein RJT21DRAFT_5465 [Scheffersomyces amazonensis]|uniref:uncharacterized protein n=1 Tax=Scheffersomyces amazonensis TaxID=1078765 RepID=UPI00315CCFDF
MSTLLKTLIIRGKERKLHINRLYKSLGRVFEGLIDSQANNLGIHASQIKFSNTKDRPINIFDEWCTELSNPSENNKLEKSSLKLLKFFRTRGQISIQNIQDKPMVWSKIISGGKFGSRNIVAQVPITDQNTDVIMKIYDPVRSHVFIQNDCDIAKTLKTCLELFKEVLILQVLGDLPNFPKIKDVGFINNTKGEYVYELKANEPHVAGLYFTYPFIQAEPLKNFSYIERQSLKHEVYRIVKSMHERKVIHGNLNSFNILVESLEDQKVWIVGFGHSCVKWRGRWYRCERIKNKRRMLLENDDFNSLKKLFK